jgi:hypothetical protein
MLGVVLVCLLVSLGVVLAGCGGGSSGTATTATTAAGETTTTTAGTAAMSGTDLGEAVGATWAEAMQKLNALLADQPEASAVQSQLEALKEEYIQKMVAYGQQRLALDSAAQAEATAATSAALNAAANADWYTTYNSNWEAYTYISGDVDFTNLLASFNTLTQYADFELLKKQNPDEASRLGIK